MAKQLLSTTFFLLFALCGLAQKLELSAGVTGNLYNYGGTSSGSKFDVYSYPVYSKKLTSGYGLQADLKLVATDGFMFGLSGGYDVVRSKADATLTLYYYYNYYPLVAAPSTPADVVGYNQTTMKQIFVNPYIGYRFKRKRYSIDVFLGGEIAFLSEHKQKVIYDRQPPMEMQTYYFGNDQARDNDADYRLKGGFNINYRKFSLNLNYAHGIADLRKKGTNTYYYYYPGSAYSQIIKLGLSYRIL